MQQQFDTTTKQWASVLKWPLLGGAALLFTAKLLPFMLSIVTNIFWLVVMLIPLLMVGWLAFTKSGRSLVTGVYLSAVKWLVHNILNAGALIKNHIAYLRKKQKVYKLNVSIVKANVSSLKEKKDRYLQEWQSSLKSLESYKQLVENATDPAQKRKYAIKLQAEANNANSLQQQSNLMDSLYVQMLDMYDKMALIGEYLAPLVDQWERKYTRLLDRQEAMKIAGDAAQAGNAVLGDQQDFMTQFAIEKIEQDIINQSAIIDVFIQDASSYVEGKMTSQAGKVRELLDTLDGKAPEQLISSFISESDAKIENNAGQFDDLLNLSLNV